MVVPMSSYVPIVDLSPFSCDKVDYSDIKVKECISNIHYAFRNVGFVYLINHGIPKSAVESMFRESRKLFEQKYEEKTPFKRLDNASNYGWDALGVEKLPKVDPDRPGDVKESYNVVPEHEGVMPWPDALVPGFRLASMALVGACERLALLVLELMARGLQGVDDPLLFAKCHSFRKNANATTLRTLYYPAIPEDIDLADQLRCGEHTDYGTMTLLFQDMSGGLEVRNRQGDYVAVTPIEDSIVVNIADLMQRWSGDILKSTPHRVVIPPGTPREARQSVAYFVHPDRDCVITCLDGSQKYEPITAFEHQQLRFKETYA